ncbi:MAG: ABC transporter permease [Calditrichaceae bacterium]|nr:ABC transporter permease [Calditrichaceae bacterium]MBN2709832.1 ABC transporter permease [Calditrichaceae bacterium]RQV95404.1 MAG: FtsX-like permease family protein [Calditrichota bacterium]
MLIFYFKTAFRNLLKNKASSIINITGLTIGLAVVIIIAVFISHELSYDNFHKNADRIYRIINGKADDKDSYAGTSAPLGPFLQSDIPEILSYTRLHKAEMVVEFQNRKFPEQGFYFADPSFFEIFTFPLINGEAGTALKKPNSMVITEKAAKKYFGSDNPVGKVLSVDDAFDFTVTAIAKDVPENSHFHFEFLIPFERLDDVLHTHYLKSWGNWNYFTYILTAENTDIEQLQSKVKDLFKTKLPNHPDVPTDLTFQPIKNIHFQFNRINIEPAFNDKYLTIFFGVAIAVLLIACVNFINLSTAQSIKRAKEIGLRKTIGADQMELLKQFLLESILLSTIAASLSIILVELILPVVNTISGKHLAIEFTNISNYLVFIGLIVFTGILAGIYPATVLASFNPVKALKEKVNQKSKISFRNVLVVFQFTVSIALIICTIIISKQISFIRTANLGFVKEQIINIPLKNRDLIMKSQTLKEEFLKNPNVISASVNNYQPSNHNQFWGGFKWEGMSKNEENSSMWIIHTDRDFINTYQIKMIEGEDYLANFKITDKRSFILNKSALKMLNWETSVGKEITYWGHLKGNVIGLMDDFHFRSLHHSIEPCAIVISNLGRNISVRIKTTDITSILASLKKTWDSFGSNISFEYYFLEDDFAKLYQSEIRISSVLEYFTFVAVFLACIGLFGLTTFMAERRKKEFGIRKVLGASALRIWKEFSINYTQWVIIANIIAWPIAYFFMNKWLQDFTYKIGISMWTFIISGGIALLIALATVSWQAIRAAMANPIKALKYE